MKNKTIIVTTICLVAAALIYLNQTAKNKMAQSTALPPPIVIPPPPGKTLEDLAKKAIQKLKMTENEPCSRKLVEEKVREAVALIEKEGLGCLSQFRGNSRFISAGTYIWIETLGLGADPIWMIIHPIDPPLERTPIERDKADIYNRDFARTVGDAIMSSERREVWICYDWHTPGETSPLKKVAFMKLAVVNGIPYVVGCGTSDHAIVLEIYSDSASHKVWEKTL